MECGYCEPVCPSKDLTTTPRQRIVLRREMQRARDDGDVALVSQLEQEYEYDAVDTCAVDGMCQTACPVPINTGDLMKRLRADNAGKTGAKGLAVRGEALGRDHPGGGGCADHRRASYPAAWSPGRTGWAAR